MPIGAREAIKRKTAQGGMDRKALSMERMQEFSKMLIRKMRRVKYEKVPLPEGYAEAEEEYKSLRDGLLRMESAIGSLESYEHGSKIYKNIKRGIEYLHEKTYMNAYRNMDMYEEAASVGELLKRVKKNNKLQSLGQKYSDVFNAMSNSKKSFNTRLAALKIKMRDTKTRINEIDYSRKRTKNMRYDLEMLMRDDGYNNEIQGAEKSEYEIQVKATLKLMKSFMEDAEVSDMLKTLCKEYRKHMEESVDSLKFVG